MSFRVSIYLVPCLVFFTACAHHRDVRPAEDGIHTVKFKTEDKGEGYSDAMSQANHYCLQSKQRAFHISEKSEYVGSMDEATYKNAKTAATVAEAVGTAGFIFGGKNESKIGGVAGIGGAVADEALGEGYQYTLQFKCK